MRSVKNRVMSAQETSSGSGTFFAVLSALTAGILLFLPTTLVGYTFSVLAEVAGGHGQAWASVVGLTYALTGIPAFVGLVLLVIPYALFRASARRIGESRALRWIGLLLVAWNVGIAAIHLVSGQVWGAVAFGGAALVILVLTRASERGDVRSIRILGGTLALTAIVLVASLAAVWGRGPTIPIDGQVVHIVLADGGVQVSPTSVHAGDVWFVVEGPDARPDTAGFAFIHGGYGATCCERPLPLRDDAVSRLATGDYQGTGSEGGWYGDTPVKYVVREGNYTFVIGSGAPGIPRESIAVLRVEP